MLNIFREVNIETENTKWQKSGGVAKISLKPTQNCQFLDLLIN